MNVTELFNEIEAAVAAVCGQAGTVLLKPVGRVLPDGLALNITVVQGDDAETIYARYWREQAEFLGVDVAWIGQSVRTQRGKAVLLGLHPDGGGLPAVLKSPEGVIWLASIASVREHFEHKQVI